MYNHQQPPMLLVLFFQIAHSDTDRKVDCSVVSFSKQKRLEYEATSMRVSFPLLLRWQHDEGDMGDRRGGEARRRVRLEGERCFAMAMRRPIDSFSSTKPGGSSSGRPTVVGDEAKGWCRRRGLVWRRCRCRLSRWKRGTALVRRRC